VIFVSFACVSFTLLARDALILSASLFDLMGRRHISQSSSRFTSLFNSASSLRLSFSRAWPARRFFLFFSTSSPAFSFTWRLNKEILSLAFFISVFFSSINISLQDIFCSNLHIFFWSSLQFCCSNSNSFLPDSSFSTI